MTMTTNNLAAEEMSDCDVCGAQTYTKTCFSCTVKANPTPKAEAEDIRIVVTIMGGAISSVYTSGPGVEVLVVDHDNLEKTTDREHWKADDCILQKMSDMTPYTKNAVLAFDGEDVICEQCDDEYQVDTGYDAFHCSKTCHDRHWRM